ncbi:MAG: VWA domain-containing protein [Desulfobacterium sp.]|nr:VWA domain-containing protein [Desulfobacterium sp.]
MHRIHLPFYALIMFVLFSIPTPTAQGANTSFPEVMIILDGSGSMWGNAGSQTKIKAAKDVLHQLVPSLPAEVKFGLTVYGHRQKGRCDDIEVIMPAGSDDRDLLLSKVDDISPKGKTPIADSIKMVVDELKRKENETTIILVSDGEETCNPDPCGVVKVLKETGIKFILHVVGFDVDQTQKIELACLADAGGGQYFDAANAADLLTALQIVQKEVSQKVEFEKAKTTKKKKKSNLGKLKVTYPASGEKSLAHIRIVRKKDDKIIKTAAKPKAESIHPLLSGEYNVIFGYANSNNQKPSEIAPITITINGGETKELALGTLVFNVADSLKKIPANTVTLRRNDGQVVLETPGKSNTYYFFTSKPLPPGTYSFEYFYKTMEAPTIAANNITINAKAESLLTLDCGIKINKHEQNMTGFDLIDNTTGKPSLQIKRRWDNDYPIWYSFIVQPGNYSLNVYIKGMNEALPIADDIVIKKGELLEFDTGL